MESVASSRSGAVVIGGMWFATEWTAFHLGIQPRLGPAWFTLLSLPVFYPWRVFEWWYAYDAYAPALFDRAGMIAASSGTGGGSAAPCADATPRLSASSWA